MEINNSVSSIILSTFANYIENRIYIEQSPYTRIRLTKVGEILSVYKKNLEDDVWIGPLTTTTLPELNGIDFRAGCLAQTRSAGRATNFTAKFDYFRLRTGGLVTCDHTLDGPNGCRIHENTRRFGGAPGIMHGPISL